MIWLYVFLLVAGLAMGFFLAKSRFQTELSSDQQQVVNELQAEVAAFQSELAQLQQDNADLRYQLGEAKKAQAYAEGRVEKLKAELNAKS